jgi:hypothetical protein
MDIFGKEKMAIFTNEWCLLRASAVAFGTVASAGLRGQTDGGGFGVGEEGLRHGVMVGGGRVRAPRRGVQGLSRCAGPDGRAGDASMIFALTGQQAGDRFTTLPIVRRDGATAGLAL